MTCDISNLFATLAKNKQKSVRNRVRQHICETLYTDLDFYIDLDFNVADVQYAQGPPGPKVLSF